jgi:hypothetical protein
MKNEWSIKSYNQSAEVNGPTLSREDLLRREISDMSAEIASLKEEREEMVGDLAELVKKYGGREA